MKEPGNSFSHVFSSQPGHESAKCHLRLMLEENLLPSTLLFYGPKGVGKKNFAEELAQVLLGSKNSAHPDLHHLIPEGKNDAHTMSAMRDLIREVGLPPFQAVVKVFIIHQAERLTENCMNALLKTLEEPPPGTYFILLCEEVGMLLPTVLSRCCLIRFTPLAKNVISKHLGESHNVPQPEADRIASFSHGTLNKALEILNKKERQPLVLMRQLLKERLLFGLPAWHEILLEIEEALEDEKHEELLFEEMLLWFRDLHLVQEKREENLYHLEALEILREQAKILVLPPMTKVYEIVTKAQQSLEMHVRSRHALEATLLQLTMGG